MFQWQVSKIDTVITISFHIICDLVIKLEVKSQQKKLASHALLR
jgi:hypothetical protein